MRKLFTIIAIIAATVTVTVVSIAATTNFGVDELTFKADLSGAQEVPGVVTNTTGFFGLQVDIAFTEADFRLDVFDGVAVTAAHLHCARPGENGSIVATLFSGGPTDVDGTLAQGTLTNASITAISGGTCGAIVNNIASLALAIDEGRIYTNVHSSANPGGEVRGQLLVR